MRLSNEERLKQKELAEKRKQFEKKIEEDRLGITRGKQKRVMRFMTYRIIKIALLITTGLMLFIYTPAVLPLTVLIALMMIFTKRIQKEKNKNVNKKYRIKIRAADSIIAIIMIVLTVSITGYNLVTAYMNDGNLNTSSSVQVKLADAGFDQTKINSAMKRISGENAYERTLTNALTLMTGSRNVFKPRRMVFRTKTPPMNLEGMESSDGAMPAMKRPSVFKMMRNMPLDMLFRQIFNMACAVMVGIMVIIGLINVIESFKYGEIKKITLGKKFETATGPNDPCPCGSGKKVKNCCGNAQHYI